MKPTGENAKLCKRAFVTCQKENECPKPGKPQKPAKCDLSSLSDCDACLAAPVTCTNNPKGVVKFLQTCAPLGYKPGSKKQGTSASCGPALNCPIPTPADCDAWEVSCAETADCMLVPSKPYVTACKKTQKGLGCGKPQKPVKPGKPQKPVKPGKPTCPKEPSCDTCNKSNAKCKGCKSIAKSCAKKNKKDRAEDWDF